MRRGSVVHLGFLIVVAGCGSTATGGGSGGSGDMAPPVQLVSIGGTVTGLLGSGLVLEDNGGDDLPVAADGTFTFATKVPAGSKVAITVKQQPTNPVQMCTVNQATTVANSDVTDVAIICSTSAFNVGGTVTGLLGSGLVLQDNGGDDLPVAADGAFTFATPVASGAGFAVTVKTPPSSPTQTCVVSGGSGTIGSANVSNVVINCGTNAYTIGGTITGLSGAGLVLQNNAGDDLPVAANGTFTFATPVASGAMFAVTVLTQPAGPTQTCAVSGGSGTVGGSAVTSVTVNCATNTFTISGTVTGLTGSGLTLQNNGGDDVTVSGSGTFSFATPVASGGSYNVSVENNPTAPWQACTVTAGGSGTVTTANITSVQVDCTTNSYPVSVVVSGLTGTGLVLQDNGGDDLSVASDGTYAFATSVVSGQPYSVAVSASPSSPWQTCTVVLGSGTMANGVTVAVNCATNSYTVGGTITGLVGSGLVLQNEGGDDLSVSVTSTFTFTTPLLSGSPYAVTIETQPAGQLCTLANATGTITNANITNVTVSCVSQLVATTSPVLVSGALSCSTIASSTGRKAAIDPTSATIYVAMNCGGTVYVSASTDRGLTFGTPVNTGLTGPVASPFDGDTAIAVGPSGTVFLAAITNGGALLYSTSTTQGATWSAPVTLETGCFAQWGVHISLYQNNVYVATRLSSNNDTQLWSNSTGGVGTFQLTTITMNGNVFGDVLVDDRNGDLWSTSDDPTFHLRESTDGGATFSAQVTPGPAAGYSTWTLGGGNIYVTGEASSLYVIPLAAPTTSTFISGFATSATYVDAQVAADSTGNAYVVAQTTANTIAIERVIAGTTAIADTRTVGTGASYPGVVAGPNNVCVVVYTQGTQVFATVQKY